MRTLLAILLLVGATLSGILVAAPAASACISQPDDPSGCGSNCVVGNVCIHTCLRICPEGPSSSPSFASVCTLHPVDKGAMVCVSPSDPSCLVAYYSVDGPNSTKTCVAA